MGTLVNRQTSYDNSGDQNQQEGCVTLMWSFVAVCQHFHVAVKQSMSPEATTVSSFSNVSI